jgi:Alw26I/Eco31I/Esp3I family type II restriction m6 adenine DNA methyltransferase
MYYRKDKIEIGDFISFIKNMGNLEENVINFLIENKPALFSLINLDLKDFLYKPFELAKIYESMKSTILIVSNNQVEIDENLNYRKSIGLFYTPRYLVKFIVGNAILRIKNHIMDLLEKKKFTDAIEFLLDLKFSDIACGTGSFLIEIISVLRKIREIFVEKMDLSLKNERFEKYIKTENEFLKYIVENCIYGVDIEKNASILCSFNIISYCGLNIGDVEIYGKNIKVGDSLPGNIWGPKSSLSSGKEKFEEFHKEGIVWSDDFPAVFSRKNPGFDLIVINPPYGKVRLESFKGQNKNRIVTESERDKVILLSHFFRTSGFYSDSIYGVLNYYKLMVERAYKLLRKKGSLGFIVPNTLLNDLSTVKLRKHMFNNMSTRCIIEIPESAEFFDGITQSFCIFISFNEKETDILRIKRDVKSVDDLGNGGYTEIDMNFIREKFPDLLSIPNTNERGIKILQKIHSHPKLSDQDNIFNRRGEVDLTKFSELISTSKESKAHRRLIRGHNIEYYQLNDDIVSKPSFIDASKFKKMLGNSPKLIDMQNERIICKQIANQHKKKRIQFTRIEPNSILANSCNYISLRNGINNRLIRYLLGFLNSSLIEWRFRITSTNNHVNNYEIGEFPIIMLQNADPKSEVIDEISELTKKIEISKNQGEKIFHLSKIDRIIFNLFEFTTDEVKFLLNHINADEYYIKLVKSN